VLLLGLLLLEPLLLGPLLLGLLLLGPLLGVALPTRYQGAAAHTARRRLCFQRRNCHAPALQHVCVWRGEDVWNQRVAHTARMGQLH